MNKVYDISIMYKDGSVCGFIADRYLLDLKNFKLTASSMPTSDDKRDPLTVDLVDIRRITVDNQEIYSNYRTWRDKK